MKASRPRARTMAHMHHMLAATATVTQWGAAGCSRAGDRQTVTLTPLPTVPATATDTAPPLPPVASATVTAPPVPPPPDPSGYLVVDMLPAPARCLGLANATSSSARFHAGASGPELEIVLALPSKGSLAGSTFMGTASAWPGQIMASTFTHGATVATVRVKPTTVPNTVGVTIPVSCGSAGQGTLSVTATFPPAARAGTTATLSLQDY